jgi:hypothetical protein
MSNTLPFSYQTCQFPIEGRELFFRLGGSHVPVASVPLPPTWGVKIDRQGNKSFEIYYYMYDPNTRQIHEKMQRGQVVMFSVDEDGTNDYYVGYQSDDVDYGYSVKNDILQNHYYRYKASDLPPVFNKRYVNYELGDIKSIFLAYKLHRGYIGLYYDGISPLQLVEVCNEFGIEPIVVEGYTSVSLDFDKDTQALMRIGVYGIYTSE